MTDNPNDHRPAPLARLSLDLKAAAGAVGWMAGSMSGVVALMYAVGFLCAKSHLNMLGVELHSGVAAGAYVEIGAKFFYITVIMLFEGLIDLGRALVPLLAVLAVLVLAVIAGIGAVVARARNTGLRAVLGKWRNALRGLTPDAVSTRVVLSGFLALVLIWSFSQYRQVFAPLRISGMLQMTCADAQNAFGVESKAAQLACKIRKQAHAVPQAYYGGLVKLVFVLFLVVVLFRGRFYRRDATRVLYIPLIILFMIYGLVLPLTYGALIMPNDFPQVNIHLKKSSEIRIPDGPFYLVHQGDKSMILWHTEKATSYVIPSSGVTTLEVIGRASMFSDPEPLPSPAQPGGTP